MARDFQTLDGNSVHHADGYTVAWVDRFTVEYTERARTVRVSVEPGPVLGIYGRTLRSVDGDAERPLGWGDASALMPRIVAGLHALGHRTEVIA